MSVGHLFKRQMLLLLPPLLLLLSAAKGASDAGQKNYPQSRIVGGATASEGQFPHQISLKFLNIHNCGGSILSSTYIVTAAHCFFLGNPPTQIPVQYLTIRAGSRDVDHGGQLLPVAEVKIHPYYYDEYHENDIAIVKLAQPLKFNDKVKPITLAKSDPPTRVPVVTSGWGLTKVGGKTTKYLQYTTLMAVRNEDCNRILSGVHESVICMAHTINNGVCNGDSGGPAVYNNELVGVTNFVVGGCASNKPDAFASIAYHRQWLKNNTNIS